MSQFNSVQTGGEDQRFVELGGWIDGVEEYCH